MKLDDTDTRILNILQENARITNKEIAEKLGLSITPVFERIKKLEKAGFIRKYVALVDHQKVDKGMIVFVFIQSKEHNHLKVKEVLEYMQELPEVMECYHVGGEHDYLLKVVVGNMQEYENFLLKKLTIYENIRHVKSTFVLSQIKHKTSYLLG
jgi:DNA-binding Lrp family transcriptional regulator